MKRIVAIFLLLPLMINSNPDGNLPANQVFRKQARTLESKTPLWKRIVKAACCWPCVAYDKCTKN